MEYNNIELGKELKEKREKAFPGIGLRRVANENVKIDYAHLFRIEAGQYKPSDDTLLKILNAYKVEPLEMLRMFNLSRLTESHHEIIEKAVGEGHGYQTIAKTFYRKKKSK